MIKAEIVNEFIESNELMDTGAEVSNRFASKGKGLRIRVQVGASSSMMRIGSEANP